MNSSDWLAPSHVETPAVIMDIEQLIYPGFTQERFHNLVPDVRNKLTVLAERMEFVKHIEKISALIAKHKRVSTNKVSLPDGCTKDIHTYSMMIDGHEFAGFDFDTDALSIYLLLTCVDTIKGQEKYEDPFKWLKKRCANKSEYDWDKLSLEYGQEYGLSKRFIAAFTNDCAHELRKEIAENFAIAKIAARTIKSESVAAWKDRSENDRVKHIASELYKMRSQFTHSSYRSFSPAVEVSYALDAKGSVLLQRIKGRPLGQVLTDVIKNLAKNLLIDGNRGQPCVSSYGRSASEPKR